MVNAVEVDQRIRNSEMKTYDEIMMVKRLSSIIYNFKVFHKYSAVETAVERTLKPLLMELRHFRMVENIKCEMEEIFEHGTMELWHSYCEQKMEIQELKERIEVLEK